jgi:hypothetical protein
VQAFYAFAAFYLVIGLMAARRVPGRPARPGLGGHLRVLGTVLGTGLFWPEQLRARLDPFSF